VKPKTILIVEDDDDIRESLRDAFEDQGYVVRCARDGSEALQSLRTLDPPCAIILDLVMPVMSGVELYEALRAVPELAAIPVVVSTSDPSRAPSGVVILKKPCNLRTMLKVVESFCSG